MTATKPHHLSSSRASLTLLFGCTLATVCGCSQGSAPEIKLTGPFVLVDTKSNEVFQADKMPVVPAANPKSGAKTLMPGMYCSRCQKWHHVPPIEVVQRTPNAARCPKTRIPLAGTGPIPASAKTLTVE